MYKKKLLTMSVITLLSFSLLAGCNEKKEEPHTNNSNVESSAEVTDNSADASKDTEEANKEVMTDPECTNLIDTLLTDGYHSSPSALKWAIVDLGYSNEDAEYFVENIDLNWYDYLLLDINYELDNYYRSEYDLRSRMESDGYDKESIDKAIDELNIDFSEICYDYMYWRCNGRYPEDESEITDMKDICESSGFTNSNIEYALTKLEEKCK